MSVYKIDRRTFDFVPSDAPAPDTTPAPSPWSADVVAAIEAAAVALDGIGLAECAESLRDADAQTIEDELLDGMAACSATSLVLTHARNATFSFSARTVFVDLDRRVVAARALCDAAIQAVTS